MAPEAVQDSEQSRPSPGDHSAPASKGQVEEIASLLRSLEQIDSERDWRGEARGIAGGAAGGKLSRGQAETVIERLRERLEAATG
jgi:hypothetical protein